MGIGRLHPVHAHVSTRHAIPLTTGRTLVVRDLHRVEALDAHASHRRAYADVEAAGQRISAAREAGAVEVEVERHEVAHAKAREIAVGVALMAVLVDPDPKQIPGALYDRARKFVAALREQGWTAAEVEFVYRLCIVVIETGRYVPPDLSEIGVQQRPRREGLMVDAAAALDLADRWSREKAEDVIPGIFEEIDAEVGLLLLNDPIACLDNAPGSPWSQLGQARIDTAAALLLRRRGLRRG